MNKQELIERMEGLNKLYGERKNYVSYDDVLDLVKQLDEPQKVQVPQFVADYIKDAKYYEWDLDDVFDHIAEESEESEIYKWFYTLGNVDIFARAWLDGYTVEKEKRYLVKMKGLRENTSYLNYDSIDAEWYFADAENGPAVGTHCTREELESAGFGWVFDCPGVEIEEVEG